MTEIETPPVGAGGEGRISKADENTLHIAPPPPEVQSPIAFRTWLQVATNTASFMWSMDRGRRGGRFYSILSDIRDAYRMTGRPDPTESDDIIDTLRAAFPSGRFDKRCRDRIGSIWSCWKHDCERLAERQLGGVRDVNTAL